MSLKGTLPLGTNPMRMRLVAFGLALVAFGLVSAAYISLVQIASLRAALDDCVGVECSRIMEEEESLFWNQVVLMGVASAGSVLLGLGLFVDDPPLLARLPRVEPPITWTWRGRELGPEIRFALLLAPIAAVSIISKNPVVLLVSLAAFSAPLVLRRKSLSPALIHRSFFLGLGTAAYLAGFSLGGALGVFCVSIIAVFVIIVLFVSLPKL
jgi:hypothetical protein